MMFRVLSILLALIAAGAAQPRLEVEIAPVFGDKPLAFDTLEWKTTTGQAVSVTRSDFLLSGLGLQRSDGTWFTPNSWSAYVSLRDGRNTFTVPDVAFGTYRKLRFTIGLPEAQDRSDLTKLPQDSPLHPLVNHMHRGSQGSYDFAAVEGLWRDPAGELHGYALHLGNTPNQVVVDIPLDGMDMRLDRKLKLHLDLRTVLQDLRLDAETRPATQGRSGDHLAATLRQNLARAFTVAGNEPIAPISPVRSVNPPTASAKGRPYRLNYANTFPQPSLPKDNPLTEEGVFLGERLFHDRRLSGNERQSCAACHKRPEYFSDDRRFSVGAFGDLGTRQSMPLFNLAWKTTYFWDGRAPTLRDQVLQPIQNPIEMHASLSDVVKHLQDDRDYPRMFQAAFGSRDVTSERMARALEQYLITLVSDDSKYDRSVRGLVKLSEQEKRGETLFNTEYDPKRNLYGAECFQCHGGATFQSKAFANNGLDRTFADAGLFITTQREGDRGKFAVPSLRNVALTSPYMHDGRFATLEEVIEHYDHGIQRSETLDPNLAKQPAAGLKLSAEDKAALLAFLNTLTDREFIRPPAGGRGGNFPPDPGFPPGGPGLPPPPFPSGGGGGPPGPGGPHGPPPGPPPRR